MKKLLIFVFIFLVAISVQHVPWASAQTPSVPSQMITLQMSTTANKYILTSKVTLNNKSSKSLINATLLTKLLSEGSERTIEGNGAKITVRDGPQLITFGRSESFSITSSQTISKKTTLAYPSAITPGNYTVVVELLDENGNSQGVTTTTIKLSGTDTFLDIAAKDCSIKVGNNTYSTVEGPLIGKNEKGEFTCVIQNNTSALITARPKIVYAVHSATQAENAGENMLAPLTIGPGKKVPVTIAIPTNLSPQVYEGLFSIVDYENTLISPTLSFRWIIPGAAATIQNVSLDNAYYPAGATAKVSITPLSSPDLAWRGPTNTNPGFSPNVGTHLTEPKVSVTIFSENKQVCGQKEQSLPPTTKNIYWETMEIAIPISKECKNPQVKAQIYEKGIEKPLASATYTTMSLPADSKKAEGQMSTANNTTVSNLLPIIGGIIVLLILGIAGFVVWKKWKKKSIPPVSPPVAVFFAVMVAGVLGMYVGGFALSPETTVHAQSAYAPFQGSVKPYNNSTDPNTATLSIQYFYQRTPPAHNPEDIGNVRDFAENNTGGDSHVSVDSTCRTIQVALKGSATSSYVCYNWAPGLTVANFVDNAPITPSNVSSPIGNIIRFPGLEVTDGAFNPGMKALYGPHIFSFQTFNSGGPREATYTLSPATQLSQGQHTLLIQVAVSNATAHDPGFNFDRFFSTFEQATLTGEHNCDGTQPCFVNLSYTFTCGPSACSDTCTQDSDCAQVTNGCTTCVPNDAGVKVCAPPPACNAGCTRDDQCAGAKDGCSACVPNDAGQKVCAPPPACGNTCVRDDQCAGAKDGCSVCLPNNAGTGKVCAPPPACGTACVRDDQCAGSKDGCSLCNGGVCKAPACGLTCTKDTDCAGAKDGCTTCGDSDTGSEKVCRPPAACGVACTKDSQCAGAKDGCTFCTAGKCSAFHPDMCSCDGIDFVAKKSGETFFPGDTVTFVAFGKVPGKDWKGSAAAAIASAQVGSMQLSLYESKASDPNNAVRIAQSAAITPVKVEDTATKVRYKVTWDQKVPASPPPGTIYRVQATLKCAPKAGVLGAYTGIGNGNYFTQLFDSIAAQFAKGSVLAATVVPTQRFEQQIQEFSPTARVLEKSCTIMRFTFD